MHAPSVGEGLQALPVIELFRERHPEAQIAYTFFSPSAETFAAGIEADFHDYLPFDTARDAERILSALRPTALVFSKLDVWPLLVEGAAAKGVKLGLLSATMSASSLRRSEIVRLALGNAYSLLDAVGAIAEDDAQRLIKARVRADKISITGDTRYDQAWQKAQNESPESALLLAPLRSTQFTKTRFTVVAGSTWSSDEERLLPAWLEVKRRHPTVRLIVASHEVSKQRLDAVESWAHSNRLRYSKLGEASVATADVIAVDRYGILGALYALADVAYVGGGFRRAGLHSLLEPAAFGAPVIIGPRHPDNRDAQLLATARAAFRCDHAAEIADRVSAWIEFPESLLTARKAALDTVRQGLGAAERSVEIVEQLMAR
jgi:3-deoxy-D-manno-octulosonic-acid transferase